MGSLPPRCNKPDHTTEEDIAVIGRSCRLPGAPSIKALWRLMSEGRCAVSSVPEDRWSLRRGLHPRLAERGKSYTWAAGVIDDIWSFDPGVFGISPREAEQMDPQQRLLLELAWEAFEDAGITPSKIAGSETGVFVGASAVDHASLRQFDMSSADAYMMTGNTLSIISNRLSYIFDLHGPSFTIDTACSSSLAAVNEAVTHLHSGRIETAVVGGVNILAAPHSFIGFSQAAMLSRRGLCQAFSANADGYVRAEGGVVILLKTRHAAERDGDHVFGFIKGSDVNSDGRTNGISLPSKQLQAKLLEKLYLDRGVDPETLAFIEAHGTGTPVGDPIEAAAIGEILGRRRDAPLMIGSLKTNIGHMEAASGLGGLLKALLALEHGELPPSLHCDTPNPEIDFEALNLEIARTLTPLSGRRGHRLAGINSFGFGGTNAHVILADAPPVVPAPLEAAPSFLILSAYSRAALAELASDYAARLERLDDRGTRALISAAAHRRERLPQRAVVPTENREELMRALFDLRDEDHELTGAARATAIDKAAPVAFVFSGNGGQFAGMGLTAYARSPVFRADLDAISEAFQAFAGWSIVDLLHAKDLAEQLKLTQIAQPLLFAIQSAACHTLRHHGLEPDVVLGHSVGEVAAAEAAGILDRPGALKTIFARSFHQEVAHGKGGMAVMIGAADATDAVLANLPGLEIAAFNSPRAVTISGDKDEIARLSELTRGHPVRVRKLDLAYPFHSALMAPVKAPLLASLGDLRHAPGRIPFISTVTGTLCEGERLDSHYWWRNVREPVRFSDAVTEAVTRGARVFVEIGPTPTLLSHINDTVDAGKTMIATLAAMDGRDKGIDPLVMTTANAIAKGARVDDAKAFGSCLSGATRVDLPNYPWQRKVYRLPETVESSGHFHSATWHPLIGARVHRDRPEWRSTLDTALCPSLADHCIDGRAILPGAAFVEMALAVVRDYLGTDQVTVCDVEIVSSMPLAAESSREIACRLSPIASHIEILSRPRLSASPWQTHVTAKFLGDAETGALPELDDHSHLKPSHAVTGAEIYAMADRFGLQYGPSFQKLERAAAVRADRILLDLTKEAAEPAFGLDPARLDACFHALVLVFAHLRTAPFGTAYIPVRFGEVLLRKPGGTFTKARIDVLRRDERIIIANILMFDEAGDVVAHMRGARFQAMHASRASDDSRHLIHRTMVLASEPTATRIEPPIALAAFREGIARSTSKIEIAADYVLLEGWATAVALQTARELATTNFIDVETLVLSGRLPQKLRPWVEDALLALERSGLCHRDRLGRHIDPEAILPNPQDILRTIAHEHQALAAELIVAAGTLVAIDAIVAGDGAQLDRALGNKFLEGFETGSNHARASSRYLSALLRRSLPTWPKDRAMRILQIGYGLLTNQLIALADDAQAVLTIFDLDRRRLEQARTIFADRGDLTFIDAIDTLPNSGFDIVVSANRLHTMHRAPGFWPALRRAMARGAIFAAIEPAPSFFRDLIFGLDACLTGKATGFDGHSVSEADWREIMQAAGLGEPEVASVSTDAGAALLLTAQTDAERRHWRGSGNALILSEDARGAETSSAFATLLASSGLHVSIVFDDVIGADLLTEAPSFVCFMAESDPGTAPAKALLDQCMRLKRLADRLDARTTRIWLVASGDADDPASDITAGLWAFSRTLANERPSLDIRRVDVAASMKPEIIAERLRDLVLSESDETEITVLDHETRVVRFESGLRHKRHEANRAEAARLTRGDSTGNDRIAWSAAQRQEPAPGEVEIIVEATGLNFRDVMFGLGLLPEDILEHGFAGPTLGLECAGRIERIGAGVKRFKCGDRVMAFAKHAFSTHVTTPAALVAALPSSISFEAAATIPVAFFTAYYALIVCARLKRNEWVLIHGGAGGVGLAALQIARRRGARVIATAGSPEKRALLRALGVDHAFDSRTGAFVEDVRRVTGEGVAIVLNSLSGEAMERSIAVLRPFGRFVELGKRDYVANTHIGLRPFRRNLSYFGVDLDQLLGDDPATSKLLMRSVVKLFDEHELTPLPHRTFDAADTIEAFRLMQQSGHVGKLVLRPPNPSDIVVRPKRTWPVSAEKVHLITGGLGGFGLETARWLAARGARNLLLVGRSGAGSDDARACVAELAAQGVRVRVEALDVADTSAMKGLFARFGRDLPPLAGIVHAAMVLDDALLANLTAERLERVLRPKVAGADILDQLTRGVTLDYFVLFSSMTTLLGNPGQAAYVAANGYLEGLARRRRRAGLPALAVAWGAIEDVGVLARQDATREFLATRAGVAGMLAQDALRQLGDILATSSDRVEEAVVCVAPMNWSLARKHLVILRSPAYRRLTSRDETSASETEKVDIAALVAAQTPDEARKIIGGLIVDEIARVLRLPKEDVARSTPLAEIGLDSLMAVELALGLESRFTLDAPLSTSASSFTVAELADHIIALVTGSLSRDDAVAQTMVERHLGANAALDSSDIMESAEIVKANSLTVKSLLN